MQGLPSCRRARPCPRVSTGEKGCNGADLTGSQERSISVISGGMPNRTGRIEQPIPPVTTMGMSRERECDPVWDLRKDVGLMGKQDHRSIVVDLRQSAGQIVEPGDSPCSTMNCQLIFEPGKPEARQPNRRIGQDGDARIDERLGIEVGTPTAPLRGEVIPPVMVSKNGIAAKRRPQPGKDRRSIRNPDRRRDKPVPRREIAQKDDEVGFQRIGAGHYPREPVKIDIRRAKVKVGQTRDPKRAAGPVRRRELIAFHPET